MPDTTTVTTSITNPIPGAKPSVAPPPKSKLPLIFGLVVVVLVALAGIAISFRQFLIREPVAPTAPQQSQADVTKILNCSLSFDVAPPESDISCVKKSYQDELSNTAGNYDLSQEKTSFKPGETIVYSFEVKNNGDQTATITATDTLSATVAFNYTFLDSNCGAGSYNATTKTLTCVATDLGPTQGKVFSFRIRLANTIPNNLTIKNLVNISDGTTEGVCSVDISLVPPSPTPSPTPSPSPTPTPTPSPSPTPTPSPVACNQTCDSNSDCAATNQICYFNRCRLATYPDRADCSVPPQPSPTPTPVVTTASCNQACTSNRGCTEANHICFEGKCRLETYPASATCTIPSSPDQPRLPEELPQSGSSDIINWIKAGIGILGAGALLLLL